MNEKAFEEPGSSVEGKSETSKPEKRNGIVILAAIFYSLWGDKRNFTNSETQLSHLLCPLVAMQELIIFSSFYFQS